jgi:hypothetical protein
MRLRSTFLIIQEHVDVFNAVLKDTATPFNLVKKELALETASDLEGRSSVIR